MYKCLNAESLGVNARQNELIELALTYKYCALDLDTESFLQQIESHGREHATRFLDSANLRVGSFDLPVRFNADDATYQQDLQKLDEIAEIAASVGASAATAIISPYCEYRPYHEDFELHRERFSEISEKLKPFGIRLAIGFRAKAAPREGCDTQFIVAPDALVTLLKTVVGDNVGICLDLWDWHVGGGTMDAIKELAVDQIASVRVADVPKDVALDAVSEEQRMLPGSTGVVPNAECLAWLSEAGYDGPVGAYCHPSQFEGSKRNNTVVATTRALDEVLRGQCRVEEAEPSEAAASGAQS